MEPHRDILQGSILEATGEAIVNAANSFLRAVFRKSFWPASIPPWRQAVAA